MKSAACIVIPVHSKEPSQHEKISFTQCFRIFCRHDIFVVAPEGLDLDEYRQLVPEFNVKFIHPKWQASKYQYNQLKLSKFFYDLFLDYHFLLTYELDSFVFRDELLHWCEKGYDYIGAPWFSGFHDPGDEIIGVGNSGFSLRNVSVARKAVSKIYLDDDDVPRRQPAVLRAAKYLWFRSMNLVWSNYSIYRLGVQGEDLFFCRTVPRTNPNFRIAPVDQSISFAFETRPELLFAKNNYRLPMGCHAWPRHNLEFWKPHIEAFGYKL